MKPPGYLVLTWVGMVLAGASLVVSIVGPSWAAWPLSLGAIALVVASTLWSRSVRKKARNAR